MRCKCNRRACNCGIFSNSVPSTQVTTILPVNKGDTGPEGPQGPQGDTPYIGVNGNWWIRDEDTGVSTITQQQYFNTEW